MDKLELIKELNKSTIKDEFDRALAESGFDLPEEDPEAELDGEMGSEMGAEIDGEIGDELDTGDEEGYSSDTGLEDDELQDIADWCEDECAEMSDDELKDALRDELDELDLDEEQLDATIDRVMSMIGRGSEEEDMGGEYEDDIEGDDIEGDGIDGDEPSLPPSDEEMQY